MERLLFTAALAIVSLVLCAQEYPFQDTSLTEDQRLDNAVSLMTVEEKLATITGQGVPRRNLPNGPMCV